ncbi:Zn-dependent peptidase ImmA (M78 family) [Trueperella bonasi]|uniref:Zn-dependent peptidase ImmA (M78 family) n=1 Tax=Trueperella bonasi TaxID=312286 RepID=A0ABT9NGT8_9ACTO|nr:ImmA/IrrE family metallo-endopeptidase [Trueperella bonasi]MDP9806618.1 Zn-dependent peptidase ImmA (M78 family) [Trueperella bonasi]
MTVYVDVAPELLMWAVDRAGWDEFEIAKKEPRLHEWVGGQKKPTLKQLQKFSHSTHTPFGLLFLPEPPEEEIPIPDMRTIGNVAVGRPSADLLDTIHLCQERQDWYRWYARDNDFEPVGFIGSAALTDRPEKVALEIREILEFDKEKRKMFYRWEDSLSYLLHAIEGLGVMVMINGIVGSNTNRKLDPNEFRGFALADPLAPLIFVNGADTKSAQIFTLTHELAHLWLGHSALSDMQLANRDVPDEELWCNYVAAEVLVPLREFEVAYRGETTVAELERLAKEFKVSTLVILRRIYDASLLSWNDYRKQYIEERERVLELYVGNESTGGGNFYNSQMRRLGRRFGRAVVSSVYEGSTSFREGYQLLGTRKHDTFTNLAAKLLET